MDRLSLVLVVGGTSEGVLVGPSGQQGGRAAAAARLAVGGIFAAALSPPVSG